MTLNSSLITIDEREWRDLFLRISKIINILFDWNNIELSFYDRKDICDHYLGRFLLKIEKMDLIISYLEVIQQKAGLKYKKYENLIHAILEKNEKSKKKQIVPNECEKNEYFLIKFYINEETFKEKLNGDDMKDFVRWLYLPV
jgi:hypothetical protein